MSVTDETINSTLGMDVASWLKLRYGKSQPEDRNRDMKAWLISGEGNQMMYDGKGKNPIPFEESFGKTDLFIVNVDPEIPLWDVRELISAFVPVIYVYRHKYTNKKGERSVAQNVKVTIPNMYNKRNLMNVLMDLREGEIILGKRVVYFHQFVHKEKPAASEEIAPAATTTPIKTKKPATVPLKPTKAAIATKLTNQFALLDIEPPMSGGGAGLDNDYDQIAKEISDEINGITPEHVGGWVNVVKGK